MAGLARFVEARSEFGSTRRAEEPANGIASKDTFEESFGPRRLTWRGSCSGC